MALPPTADDAGDADDQRRHWDAVYARARGVADLSWHQASPVVSLQLIAFIDLPHDAAILDIGGGGSTLVDALCERGYSDITVLDISATALAAARQRAGERAARWALADVLSWKPERHYDLWHDRAMLHFLVDREDRERYLQTLRAALYPGGHAIIGAFAPGAPDHCSGLPVQHYDADGIMALLGDGFEVVAVRREVHHTPAGVAQPFTWVAALYAPERISTAT